MLHQLQHLGQLVLAAEEWRRRDREVRPVQALQRWELVLAELVDPLGSGEILQPVYSQIPHPLRGQKRRRGGREQHLPPVAAGSDPGGPVHVDPDVPLLRQVRGAGVDTDTNSDRTRGETFHRFGGGRERTRRCREGNEEGVSLSVHLDTTVGVECIPQDAAMRGQRVGILNRAQLLQQPGRALHVGEEEAHGSGREIPNHGGMMRQGAVRVTSNVLVARQASRPVRHSAVPGRHTRPGAALSSADG